jgi:hypothetical protein
MEVAEAKKKQRKNKEADVPGAVDFKDVFADREGTVIPYQQELERCVRHSKNIKNIHLY